ncbi:MAG: VWA domain-containing protein [Pseudomonadota bacterium]
MIDRHPEIDGRLADNVVHFTRALRAAGLPVGTGKAVEAARAVAFAGFEHRTDFYHALAACLISRPEHRPVFDACFAMFWRNPQILEKMMGLMLPEARMPGEERQKQAGEDRAAEALTAGAQNRTPPPPKGGEEVEFDARLTFSDQEVLRSRDFEQMSTAEQAAAKRAIARLSLPVKPLPTRRMQAHARGQIVDWRRTMRSALRNGDFRELERKTRRTRWPSLVVLCDISGSMAAYSRMLLHFFHAAANAKGAGWSKVHAFTFGTELTNITRHLRHRDVDEALARAGTEARDWEGGTRIGACLERFNKDWSRRVLSSGSVVLLITDGLDRDDPERLAREAERLQLSCRRFLWLNPLLRWDGFEARARGIRALLPHVDCLKAAHSIQSLEELSLTLSDMGDAGDKPRLVAGLARPSDS